ncbi:unnamed protein product [Angiostrongylus costaricensis]|uniref:Uncharacterized protein n=1 Tax=Angiostrongylus costaricensis TaxID=334426 RepID=A0A0R3PAL0_ANGCS|nr:unnamed protein product [Angiostrongylus costaricensis]
MEAEEGEVMGTTDRPTDRPTERPAGRPSSGCKGVPLGAARGQPPPAAISLDTGGPMVRRVVMMNSPRVAVIRSFCQALVIVALGGRDRSGLGRQTSATVAATALSAVAADGKFIASTRVRCLVFVVSALRYANRISSISNSI